MGRQSKVANEVPQIFILQTAVKIAGLVLSRFEIVEDENIAPSLKQTRHERRLNTRPPVFLQIDAISREKPDCSLKEQIRTGVLLKAPPEIAVRPCLAKASGKSRAIHPRAGAFRGGIELAARRFQCQAGDVHIESVRGS